MEITDNAPAEEDLLTLQHEKDRKDRKRVKELIKEVHKERIKMIESDVKPTPILGTDDPTIKGLKRHHTIRGIETAVKEQPAVLGLPTGN